ncbi:PhoPQ-activated pathogenicity-related family protein [Methylocaldum sp.]|uniref:PhoPQ-activated pathogenicity-related family protein n=1 Tax=Methylocaldum sp. TaxID=1969727 RepID=UPI002D301242|nr:PhoPQ-activated protein PqaA family protein [Methylocaldum sp.]HYE35606.1 PhoPQ-activated protein PqaA family protein [Methylocaldum sp.]
MAGALEDYVNAPDTAYRWRHVSEAQEPWGRLIRLELISQKWHGETWSHGLLIVQPRELRNPETAFLLITHDGAASIDLLKMVAERAGAIAAAITGIPNQPLYGRSEDALVAYTFERYATTNDKAWPLLFPMVKSAVRGMDAVQEFVRRKLSLSIDKFLVAGASKRGWTTWLTAAVDKRVQAIAPMVFDMLNIKAQLQWTEKVYGRQSEYIHDYTDLGLHRALDDTPMQRLRVWVDPYAYRELYTMPKLLLLGTNDPYWTVDSLRHYWDDLPEPKLLFQAPNAGHGAGSTLEARQTLATFFELIASNHPLPRLAWTHTRRTDDSEMIQVKIDCTPTAIRLWTAESSDRDFRNDVWSSRSLDFNSERNGAAVLVRAPRDKYRAYLIEVDLRSPSGHPYQLSTEARVLPDSHLSNKKFPRRSE